MKVFLSWSGEQSRQVAEALRDWLPNVIQSIVPFMSEEDIDKGTRGYQEIAQQLNDSKVGIICLTRENINKPWINFEAGAISKTVEDTYVCPYLYKLEPTDLTGPLSQFQATMSDYEDTKRLLLTINKANEKLLISENKLEAAFNKWWADYEDTLKKIPEQATKSTKIREDRDILNEIVPAHDNYQAEQNYQTLMNEANKDLRKSGQPRIEDNKINPFLKGLLKLLKKK